MNHSGGAAAWHVGGPGLRSHTKEKREARVEWREEKKEGGVRNEGGGGKREISFPSESLDSSELQTQLP